MQQCLLLLVFFLDRLLATFINDLFKLYTDLFFTYLEINPLGEVIFKHFDSVRLFGYSL